jgi:phage tail-like protein
MAARTTDPYKGFRFTVELGSILVAGFSECTGLSMEAKVFEYKEGGNNSTTLKFPEAATYGNVTLKHGFSQSTDLLDWQLDVVDGLFSINSRASNPNIAIILNDETGTPALRWNLVRALPVKWTGPDMKAGANEIAIETLELAHEGIQKG